MIVNDKSPKIFIFAYLFTFKKSLFGGFCHRKAQKEFKELGLKEFNPNTPVIILELLTQGFKNLIQLADIEGG